MLDHMTFRVTDIGRAKAFYSAALAPLGYTLAFEGNYGMNILGFAYPDPAEPDGKKADVWFIDGPSPHGGPAATSGCHLAWRAESRAQVDAFYHAAGPAGFDTDHDYRGHVRVATGADDGAEMQFQISTKLQAAV